LALLLRLLAAALGLLLAGGEVGFAAVQDVLEPGQAHGGPALELQVIHIPHRVNLSDRVTPAARLQNRACDFRRTRLLDVFCLVMAHGSRDGMVTVSVEQLEVDLFVVPVVPVSMVNL
jgi:hypothetical protein